MNPILSVVIPAYARPAPLLATLRSLAESSTPFTWEVLVIDDGSPEPLAPLLQRECPPLPLRVIRQDNHGLIHTKNRGLRESCGEFVLFLDSDDLVHPGKLQRQVERLRETGAEICYTDSARLQVGRPLSEAVLGSPYPESCDIATAADFFLRVQPAPHSAMFRRSYLEAHLQRPIVPADSLFDPIGEVWIYYNLAPYPARLAKASGVPAIIGDHPGPRLTNHWERQAIAAAALMRCFLQRCPELPHAARARSVVAQLALEGWRDLPRDFPQEIADVRLAIWRSGGTVDALEGGRKFRLLSRVFGPERAARIIKAATRVRYRDIATLPEPELLEFHRRAEALVAACSEDAAVQSAK